LSALRVAMTARTTTLHFFPLCRPLYVLHNLNPSVKFVLEVRFSLAPIRGPRCGDLDLFDVLEDGGGKCISLVDESKDDTLANLR